MPFDEDSKSQLGTVWRCDGWTARSFFFQFGNALEGANSSILAGCSPMRVHWVGGEANRLGRAVQTGNSFSAQPNAASSLRTGSECNASCHTTGLCSRSLCRA